MSRSYDGELKRDPDYREPYEVQDFEDTTNAAATLGGIRWSKAKADASRENRLSRAGGHVSKTRPANKRRHQSCSKK